ncbi:sulfatase family protein [Spirillospora albida]|uniref:sulfatase family protein n=1 Tax=Spirillospora albida TaxID=58123 RepID=UPI0004BF995B|nr:sulfatase [Spirillospora albida]
MAPRFVPPPKWAPALAAGLAAFSLAGCVSAAPAATGTAAAAPAPATPRTATTETATETAAKPNIVYILVDDLSNDLLRFMPTVRAMQKQGTTFTKYFVSNSLCCASRASTLTGQYPHSSGVWGNLGPNGGYQAFAGKADRNTFATELDAAGYRNGMIGKYLNGYKAGPEGLSPVGPGWDEWYVGGSTGYRQYDWYNNENGRLVHYGDDASDYGTDVMARQAASFIDRAAPGTPYMLEIAPFSPHTPSIPAPRHTAAFPGLTAPRTGSFGKAVKNAPKWLRHRGSPTPARTSGFDRAYRLRAQSALTLDDLVRDVLTAVQRSGRADDTYVVFGSDNGYHLGEHRLAAGKRTAFDHDINVPLIVTGPGVRRGATVDALTSNVDIAPTFTALAGRGVPSWMQGRDLAPLLYGRAPGPWRTAVLVEYLAAKVYAEDPDTEQDARVAPTRYRAIRRADRLWVEYASGERASYDMRRDPHQLHNTAGGVDAGTRARLHRQLTAISGCTTNASCLAADGIRW